MFGNMTLIFNDTLTPTDVGTTTIEIVHNVAFGKQYVVAITAENTLGSSILSTGSPSLMQFDFGMGKSSPLP